MVSGHGQAGDAPDTCSSPGLAPRVLAMLLLAPSHIPHRPTTAVNSSPFPQ